MPLRSFTGAVIRSVHHAKIGFRYVTSPSYIFAGRHHWCGYIAAAMRIVKRYEAQFHLVIDTHPILAVRYGCDKTPPFFGIDSQITARSGVKKKRGPGGLETQADRARSRNSAQGFTSPWTLHRGSLPPRVELSCCLQLVPTCTRPQRDGRPGRRGPPPGLPSPGARVASGGGLVREPIGASS